MEKPLRVRRVRRIATAAVVPLLGAAAAGCGAQSHDWSAMANDPGDAVVSASPAGVQGGGRTVDPAKPLTIKAGDGESLSDVTAVDAHGRILAGQLNNAGTVWTSTDGLAAGEQYTVKVAANRSDGSPAERTLRFRTGAASNLLRADISPSDGSTVGVGEPVVVGLSRPVKDAAARRTLESRLTVTSEPKATGSWYWVDDKTLHWRPTQYWPAHAKVTVAERLGGVKIADGVYGEPDRAVRFAIGDSMIATADGSSDTMTVRRNGNVIRTMPITMGKPGFRTRSGIKVVLEKDAFVQMKSSTVGIPAGSANSYDLPVHWATRMTLSGEFVHAAPWSVGSQGAANVSHGCIGMSTGNAEWFFDAVKMGDVVKVVNSGGHEMEPFGNGYGDWNVSADDWKKGSAGGAVAAAGSKADPLSPVNYLKPFS
ncbi:hypothetical protein BIV57_10555 [Mangrovactinospora gilvigrisea]|uniref:L,D-TPase catalytic domain-containing protein n=1 Tax=Mangrovactinospora gilvigrisea TaxID=1428644 RepID=A0A1J7C7P7_9ACTN|nr:Ig-like domain-containing protein [Mangrovactinospora gilvigrisea]OIV37556.1 hypothetical protein BIV57_10555 [Mangrovactinospora gilvigrisea]